MNIPAIVEQQRDFFKSLKTKDISFRKAALRRLQAELTFREKDIVKAIHDDFRKPEFETVFTELGLVFSELRRALRKIDSWSRPRWVMPVPVNFPSISKIHKEPYGTILIIAPWNFPFQLVFSPLVGAITAGNTVVIKPSEHSANTSRIITEIIEKVFEPGHVTVVEGDADVASKLLLERWDYIFFTGSITVGRIVAKAAAENLTPVTLELGGKNPCIIDETADLKLAAKRIMWGKFITCGQTCLAPDYVLIHESVKDTFVNCFIENIEKTFGKDAKLSPDYSRIINSRNFESLVKRISGEKLLYGGQTDATELYISPTLIDNPSCKNPIMEAEIFGPIMPVITFKTEHDVFERICSLGKPLSFYVFSKRRRFIRRVIDNLSFGGATINDTIVHFANHHLPFGGVGNSGMGAYRGKQTFDTFTHRKGVTTRGTWFDFPLRYAPYKGKLKGLKFFLRWFT